MIIVPTNSAKFIRPTVVRFAAVNALPTTNSSQIQEGDLVFGMNMSSGYTGSLSGNYTPVDTFTGSGLTIRIGTYRATMSYAPSPLSWGDNYAIIVIGNGGSIGAKSSAIGSIQLQDPSGKSSVFAIGSFIPGNDPPWSGSPNGWASVIALRNTEVSSSPSIASGGFGGLYEVKSIDL